MSKHKHLVRESEFIEAHAHKTQEKQHTTTNHIVSSEETNKSGVEGKMNKKAHSISNSLIN
jgi:hypothetical protein